MKDEFKMSEEQKVLFDALAPLSQKTCLNSLKGMSNIDAYEEAGGKGKTKEAREASASRMLSNVKAKAFLDSMKQTAISSAIMQREEALEILSKNARVKISDIATFSYRAVGADENGEILETVWKMKDSEDIDPDVMACIKSVTMTKNGPKIELHDQQGAIKQLATMQGWDAAAKYDHTSSDGSMATKGINITATPEEAARIYTEMMEGK